MNVFRFDIEIVRKDREKPVKTLIIDKYKDVSDGAAEHIINLKAKWNAKPVNVKSLYLENDLLVTGNREGTDYFIFDKSSEGIVNINRVTLEVLILSRSCSIDHALNTVIVDIKDTIKGGKLKVIKTNDILLFPFNVAQNDIYDPISHIIKAGFKRRSLWSKFELFRFVVILFLTILSYFLHIFGNFDENTLSVLFALRNAGLFFVLSDILIKFPIFFDKNHYVSIENLSDFIQHYPEDPYSGSEKENMQDPTE